MISLPGTPLATSTPTPWNRQKIFADLSDDTTPPVIIQSSKAHFTSHRPVQNQKGLRPVSAPPFPNELKLTPVTIAKTPHCARPTKSWLSRIQQLPKEENEQPQIKEERKTKYSPEERRNIWQRLWLARGVGRKNKT